MSGYNPDPVSSARRVSVIIPVRNGAHTLPRCLAPLRQTQTDRDEIIVVDDRSTDDSAQIARAAGASSIPSTGVGPAAARNAGGHAAQGDVLLFIDADVEARPSTIHHVRDRFDAEPGLAAVFGSYDDEPEAANFVSQYRNLLHHYTHQTSARESGSFWAGCGAIRRDVFLSVGGFDERRYPRPAIEDIELGLRLKEAGHRVQLDRGLLVRHLKRWTLSSMLKTDIVDRAYPWSMLLLSRGSLPNDLNLRWQHRASAALVALLAATLVFLVLGQRRVSGVPAKPAAAVMALLLIAALLPLNRGFYTFLVRRRGWLFALGAIPIHFLYYFYSGLTYAVCWVSHHSRRTLRLPRGHGRAPHG
jgi:glycosyltransferase involved in cell wall biosynthesis